MSNRRHRVLMASDFYPPFIGGAERQVQLLCRTLAERGHEVAVATVWHEGQPATERDEDVKVHRIRALTTSVPWFSSIPGRRFHPPTIDPLFAWRLRGLIKRFQPDVVHASGWIAYSCAGALLGLPVPLVISVRDYGYTCATRTLLRQGITCSGPSLIKCLVCASDQYGYMKATGAVAGIALGRGILRRKVAAIHSVSRFVQSTIREHLIGKYAETSRSRTITIPDVVIPGFVERDSVVNPDLDPYLPIGLPEEPYILFVGAIQQHKGVVVLLNAYRQMEAPPPLVMIGSTWGDSLPDVPQGVTILQNLPHQQVMAAWQRCLFGVTPSIWPDPLPGVVREGMSAGKAMIGSEVGGIIDIISDEQNGLLVPPGDSVALANAMHRLIVDVSLRERLGQNGRSLITNYLTDSIVPQFENLYAELKGT